MGLEPERPFGPGLAALRGYLHEHQHGNYERPVERCRDVVTPRISEGGIDRLLRWLTEQARLSIEWGQMANATVAIPGSGGGNVVRPARPGDLLQGDSRWCRGSRSRGSGAVRIGAWR